jgi:hypothetical protein
MKVIKNKFLINFVVFLFVLTIVYLIDKRLWMKRRVEKTNWEYDNGYYIGDYLYRDTYKITNDTITLEDGKRFLLKYQYFNRLVITDLERRKEGVYVTAMSSKAW